MTGYSASPASDPVLDTARYQLSRQVQQSADLDIIYKALLNNNLTIDYREESITKNIRTFFTANVF